MQREGIQQTQQQIGRARDYCRPLRHLRATGDWEAVTIIGASHRGATLSVVERVSTYSVLHKLDAATAAKTTIALINRLHVHRKRVHTITADNGKEFAGHKIVAKRLGAGFYFATPYHAWSAG